MANTRQGTQTFLSRDPANGAPQMEWGSLDPADGGLIYQLFITGGKWILKKKGSSAQFEIADGTPSTQAGAEEITPAQITADQNDYNPSSTATVWRLSSDAIRKITGIGGTAAKRRITIYNVGAFEILFGNQDVGSLAGKRIITGVGADGSLLPDRSITLFYDGTTTRWRVES